MKKFSIKLSSPKETPKDDQIFVIEESTESVNRIKVRRKDIEKKIEELSKQKVFIETELSELDAIEKEINKLNKK